MAFLLRLLAFLLAAHVLGGCASFKTSQRQRRVAAAQTVLTRYGAETPPEQQLSDLIERNPGLAGQKVRVVTKRDTVRVPGATLTVQLPAVSTVAEDHALIDSLMALAGRQMHAKDSATFAQRLRAELAQRPRLSRDTARRTIGPLTLQLWTDRHGRPQAKVVKVEEKVGFEQEVTETGPVLVKRELAFWERVWLFLKDAFGIVIGVLVCVGGIWLFFFIRRQRAKTPPTA